MGYANLNHHPGKTLFVFVLSFVLVNVKGGLSVVRPTDARSLTLNDPCGPYGIRCIDNRVYEICDKNVAYASDDDEDGLFKVGTRNICPRGHKCDRLSPSFCTSHKAHLDSEKKPCKTHGTHSTTTTTENPDYGDYEDEPKSKDKNNMPCDNNFNFIPDLFPIEETTTCKPSTTEQTETPTTKKPLYPCVWHGNFPDPKDCTRYFFCDINKCGDGYVAIHKSCMEGLVFNESLRECIPEENLHIEERCCTKKFKCVECGDFPDPHNCTMYYRCIEDDDCDSGFHMEHKCCPRGKKFDKYRRKCYRHLAIERENKHTREKRCGHECQPSTPPTPPSTSPPPSCGQCLSQEMDTVYEENEKEEEGDREKRCGDECQPSTPPTPPHTPPHSCGQCLSQEMDTENEENDDEEGNREKRCGDEGQPPTPPTPPSPPHCGQCLSKEIDSVEVKNNVVREKRCDHKCAPPPAQCDPCSSKEKQSVEGRNDEEEVVREERCGHHCNPSPPPPSPCDKCPSEATGPGEERNEGDAFVREKRFDHDDILTQPEDDHDEEKEKRCGHECPPSPPLPPESEPSEPLPCEHQNHSQSPKPSETYQPPGGGICDHQDALSEDIGIDLDKKNPNCNECPPAQPPSEHKCPNKKPDYMIVGVKQNGCDHSLPVPTRTTCNNLVVMMGGQDTEKPKGDNNQNTETSNCENGQETKKSKENGQEEETSKDEDYQETEKPKEEGGQEGETPKGGGSQEVEKPKEGGCQEGENPKEGSHGGEKSKGGGCQEGENPKGGGSQEGEKPKGGSCIDYEPESEQIESQPDPKPGDVPLVVRDLAATFKCRSAGKFADPTNCTAFYLCHPKRSADGGFYRLVMNCPSGELFDAEQRKCLPAREAVCG